MRGQDPGGASGVSRRAREVDIRSTWGPGRWRRRRRERGWERRRRGRHVGSIPPPDLPEGCGLPHARSLLPFLLSGVADEVEANGVNALALVEAVGAANDAALGVDGDGAAAVLDESPTLRFRIGGGGGDAPAAVRGQAVRGVPAARPPLLPSLLRGALTEVREWTSGKRNAGARLLGTVVAFAEASASADTSGI